MGEHVVPVQDLIPRARIAASFARAARHYDAHASLQREVADWLLSQFSLRHGSLRLLDLGCGTGYCAVQLERMFPTSLLVALDIALPMLAHTRAHGITAIHAVCADAAQLPFPDHSFDAVLSSLSLQWCGEPERVFSELGRVLAPGGIARLTTFGPESLIELRQAWASVDSYTHVNRFDTQARLLQAAVRCGLQLDIQVQIMTRWYPDLRSISRELKGIGAHNMNRNHPPGLSGRQAFARAEQAFARQLQPGKGIPVTYEIFCLSLTRSL